MSSTTVLNTDEALPRDILTAIGLSCWATYKALFIANKWMNSELSKHRPSQLFTHIHVPGTSTRVADVYRYVWMTDDMFHVTVFINGKERRSYELLGRPVEFAQVASVTRRRLRPPYVYEERVVHQHNKKHIVTRERRHTSTHGGQNIYVEKQTLLLQAVPNGTCVKYVNGAEDDITDWIIQAPRFFQYSLDKPNE